MKKILYSLIAVLAMVMSSCSNDDIEVFKTGGVTVNVNTQSVYNEFGMDDIIRDFIRDENKYGIKVFSVDTRAWKSRVLGTSKPVFEPLEGVENPQKFGSVRKAIKLGFGEQMKVKSCKTRSFRYDDDMADAICISLYGFSGYPYTLSLEQ